MAVIKYPEVVFPYSISPTLNVIPSLSMSTQQIPTTPPPEYEDSLGPPTFEEIDLSHVLIDVKSVENNTFPQTVTKKVTVTTEIGEANSDNNSRHADYVSPWVLTSVYSVLIVNTILTSTVIMILILMINDAETKNRPTLIAWCMIEVALRLLAIYITARNYSVIYTITNSLGIFLGKEYYLTFVNSIWPDSDPFDAVVDLPGIKIDLVWLKQGFYYVLYNIMVGISLWIVTLNEVADGEDDYAKLLTTTGLVACLINMISYLVGIASMAWVYRPTGDLD
ncbi:3048_t:CDS:2 [Paraglomus occultum]|uniref:3048_t:CDS:1 n=1 Tax=Paraglomus occultum TaxID=144539 RepID=A0A9N9FZM5_9GLOM|nr:3048_t:CDS:2 [Paraglomus occultum]